MTRRRIIGIVLLVVSLGLVVFVYSEVHKTVTLSGLMVGSTATYTPPFEFHGPLVVLAGVAAAALFITGLYLVSADRNK